VKLVAISGMESTKDMIATKGRASFLGKRTIGHTNAGASIITEKLPRHSRRLVAGIHKTSANISI